MTLEFSYHHVAETVHAVVCAYSVARFATFIAWPLREKQRHHTKRSTGNPWLVADLVGWAGVKKAVLEEAKGKINQNHADLLSLGAYQFVESIGKGPW